MVSGIDSDSHRLRTEVSIALANLDLADLDLKPGAPLLALPIGRENHLPWANNATGSMKRVPA